MTDLFSWCPISLGRWWGTRVRLHGLFVVFVLAALVAAALAKDRPVAQTAGWLALLVLAVILHELGHACVSLWLGSEPEEVRLWPLGNLTSPAPVNAVRYSETIWIAAAGPITSLVLAALTAVALHLAGASMTFNPFGNFKDGTGAPILAGGSPAAAFSRLWWMGWFGYLNWVICLANLVPALPMDMGRMVRAIWLSPNVGHPRDSMIGPHLASAVAILLLLFGLGRLLFAEHATGAINLVGLAAVVYLTVRAEVRMLEEEAFYDESVFGYDFSEGYTSLEGSGPRVRPCRESALRRWRRRRSEQRRERQLAREAAEEQRMDEILTKLHRQGRSALTDEEQRFLVRVSARFRDRSRSRE